MQSGSPIGPLSVSFSGLCEQRSKSLEAENSQGTVLHLTCSLCLIAHPLSSTLICHRHFRSRPARHRSACMLQMCCEEPLPAVCCISEAAPCASSLHTLAPSPHVPSQLPHSAQGPHHHPTHRHTHPRRGPGPGGLQRQHHRPLRRPQAPAHPRLPLPPPRISSPGLERALAQPPAAPPDPPPGAWLCLGHPPGLPPQPADPLAQRSSCVPGPRPPWGLLHASCCPAGRPQQPGALSDAQQALPALRPGSRVFCGMLSSKL